MPHYLFETGPLGGSQFDAAIKLAAARFPELIVEHRYTARDLGGRDVWVVRAPSTDHVRRWSDAAHVRPRALATVEADTPDAGLGQRDGTTTR